MVAARTRTCMFHADRSYDLPGSGSQTVFSEYRIGDNSRGSNLGSVAELPAGAELLPATRVPGDLARYTRNGERVWYGSSNGDGTFTYYIERHRGFVPPTMTSVKKEVKKEVKREAKKVVKRAIRQEPSGPIAVNPRRVNMLNRRPQVQLSSCVKTYLGAIADPWSHEAIGACIPSDPSFPSQKLYVFFRGTLTTGTNNVGWIWIAPFKLVENDAACIWYTDNTTGGAYTGTTLVNAITNGVNLAARTNSPYTSAQINGTNVSARLVSCGIRVAYAGTNLNQGGRIIGFEEPTHQPLNGATYAQLRAYRDVTEFEINDHWHGVTYTPIAASETAYSTAAGASGVGFMAVMLNSAAASQPFSFEVVASFECVGRLTAYSATHNLVDPIGYAAARQVIQDTDSSSGVVADDGALKSAQRAFWDAAGYVASTFTGAAATVAYNAGAGAAHYAAQVMRARLRTGVDRYALLGNRKK